MESRDRRSEDLDLFLAGEAALEPHQPVGLPGRSWTNTDLHRCIGNQWFVPSFLFGYQLWTRIMNYWIAYGIPTIILLIALIYAIRRAGWLSPREERQLDANTRMAQERDDPEMARRKR